MPLNEFRTQINRHFLFTFFVYLYACFLFFIFLAFFIFFLFPVGGFFWLYFLFFVFVFFVFFFPFYFHLYYFYRLWRYFLDNFFSWIMLLEIKMHSNIYTEIDKIRLPFCIMIVESFNRSYVLSANSCCPYIS